MIYYTRINNHELRLEINTDADGNTSVKMPDGRELGLQLTPVMGSSMYSLLVDNYSHEVYLSKDEEGGLSVTLDGLEYGVSLETERQHRFSTLANAARVDTGEINIKSPMPGLVTIVGVEQGSTVEQGQRLLVLEAMKMENEIRAPRAGIIKTVNVQKGQTVEQNKVLLVLE
jgi:biotin carboxyl carrier protein